MISCATAYPSGLSLKHTGGFFYHLVWGDLIITAYTKPHLTINEQCNKLIDRGLKCNKKQLKRALSQIGYYRLSGYAYSHLTRDKKQFRKETSLDNILNDYYFDSELRNFIFKAIEVIEIYLRSQLAYHLGKDDKFGFLNHEKLPRLSKADHNLFLHKCKQSYVKSSETFVEHFSKTYSDEHELPPYWILVNLLDFGSIFTLYRGASNHTRTVIAQQLGVKNKVFESWLRALNTIRNICAHHARLWNKTLGVKPKIPKEENWQVPVFISGNKMFGIVAIISYLLREIESLTLSEGRFLEFFMLQDYGRLTKMGFPSNRQESPALFNNH